MAATETDLRFVATEGTGEVSARLDRPDDATALLVLAHGAGAGMHHHFMASMVEALVARRLAVFRYQFPYTEQGRRRPDPQPRLVGTVRSAVRTAAELAPELPLFAGGKSMGGRMTSHAAADGGLEPVRGVVFLGFPLHPAGKPGITRAEHLAAVTLPMLFVQGTRDKLAGLPLLEPVLAELPTARMHIVEDGDHSFTVRKTRGFDPAAVIPSMADAVVAWVAETTAA